MRIGSKEWGAGVLALVIALAGSVPGASSLPAEAVKTGMAIETSEESAKPGPSRGRAALDECARLRKAAYKLEEEQRDQSLLEVAARLGTLADDRELSAAERAEAAFRAGEILRAREQVEAAVKRFAQAVDVAGSAPDSEPAAGFGARAQLELAHAQRRSGPVEAALAAYAQVGARFPKQAKAVGQAATWRSKLWLKSGNPEQAQAEAAVVSGLMKIDALEAVRVADGVALELAEAGETGRAEAILKDLEQLVEPLLAQDDGRLREALSGLRVTVLLYGS